MPSLASRLGTVVEQVIEDPGRVYRRLRLRCGARVFDPQPEGVGIYLYPGEHLSALIVRCHFERALRKIFAQVLRPGWTVIDVGANLGFYTAIAAKLVGTSGRVFAFEPSQREWQRAEETIRANGLRNVELYRAAVGDTDGTVSLTVCKENFGAYNSIGRVTHPNAIDQMSHVEQVPCRALDSFVAEKRLPQVHVVKMDVEGAEELVLRGGKELFAAVQGPLIFCEISHWTAAGLGSSSEAILRTLRQYDYRVYEIVAAGDSYQLRPLEAESHIEYAEAVALKPSHADLFAGAL